MKLLVRQSHNCYQVYFLISLPFCLYLCIYLQLIIQEPEFSQKLHLLRQKTNNMKFYLTPNPKNVMTNFFEKLNNSYFLSFSVFEIIAYPGKLKTDRCISMSQDSHSNMGSNIQPVQKLSLNIYTRRESSFFCRSQIHIWLSSSSYVKGSVSHYSYA